MNQIEKFDVYVRRYSRMDTRLLTTFVYVAELAGFTWAAAGRIGR